MPDPIFHGEAEESIIGAVITDPSLIELIDLRPAEFYVDRHRVMWSTMLDMHKAGIGIDFVTLMERLDSTGKLAQVGNAVGVSKYTLGSSFYTYNAKDYAAIIRDKAKRRQILQSANDLAKLAYSDGDIEQGISQHFNGLANATQSSTGAIHWGMFFEQLFDETTERMDNPRDIWGIPTGFTSFDRVTGGLQSHELMVLSGEPGVGKTMLAMQMAANMADTAPGAIYSMEMTGRAVARRLVSARASIETRKIKTGRIDAGESAAFTQAIDELAQKPVYMSESETWTTASLRADLTRLIVQQQIKWFIVDYLYLMNDSGKDEIEKTQNISRGLKQTCKALGLSGLAIHSMNKAGMANGDGKAKKPGQADLRGSAQVNYDADLICFLKEFAPVTSAEQYISTKDGENMRTLWFSKGRELENPRKYIHLVKRPGYPFFGDYQEGK